MSSFEKQLAKLNPEQLKAVKSIEGPVMVLAGPGTGKTQVLSLRIAEILRQTQISPKNIIALTFSEAGVTSMRERLVEIIGAEAHQVEITTFHSFANEIIATYGYAFEEFRLTTSIDELEQYRIVEKIILSTELQIFSKIRNENYYVKPVVNAINNAKREAITPQQLLDFAKDLDITSTKKVESEKLERQQKVLTDLAIVYKKYNEQLRQEKKYDFGDMLLRAIELINTNLEVKQYIQERFQYLLVDEYQDTNNAQNQLLELIADFFDTPNLFVVGDDKQAIYRFQGASVENMAYFLNKYPKLELINLVTNYRSSDKILDVADELISKNASQIDKIIKISLEKLKSTFSDTKKPQLITVENSDEELLVIFNLIKDLQKKNVELNEIAVLCRTNKEVKSISSILNKLGMITKQNSEINVLNERQFQAIIQIFKAIIDPLDNVATTLALKVLCKDQLSVLNVTSSYYRDGKKLIEAALENESLRDTAQLLLDWHQNINTTNLVDLVEEVIYQGDIINALFSRPKLYQLELLTAFVSKLKEFAQKHAQLNLADFVEYINAYKNYELELKLELISHRNDGVFVNTVHQAKGLEFEAVIIPSLNAKNWGNKQRASSVELPAELVVKKTTPSDEQEDMRRLMYVALTRSKKHLYLTFAKKDSNAKEQLQSALLEEFGDSVERIEVSHSEKEIEQHLSSSLAQLPAEHFTEEICDYISKKLEGLPFSFTSYWDYKTCPRTFLLKHVFNFPEPYSPTLAFGSAIHRALEIYSKKFISTTKRPSLEQLKEFFTDAINQEMPFNNLKFLAAGIAMLEKYYDQVLIELPPPIEVEYNFKKHKVMLKNYWLNGKIDAIELIDKKDLSVRLVDYKTGSSSKSEKHVKGQISSSDGKYYEQLKFYALLARLDKSFPYKIKQYEIRFIDDKHEFKRVNLEISGEEIDQFSSELENTLNEIVSAKDFPQKDEKSAISQLFPILD